MTKTQKVLVLNGNYVGGKFSNPIIKDDGTHIYYLEVRYENGTFSINNLKDNT